MQVIKGLWRTCLKLLLRWVGDDFLSCFRVWVEMVKGRWVWRVVLFVEERLDLIEGEIVLRAELAEAIFSSYSSSFLFSIWICRAIV